MVRTKVGFVQAKVWQDYETYALILSAAFGGKSKTRPPKPEELAENMSTEQMMAQFSRVMK